MHLKTYTDGGARGNPGPAAIGVLICDEKNEILAGLEKSGAKIFMGHEADYVRGSDVVVYSSAIGPDHPERRAAAERGIQLMHRSEALAEMCEGKFTIAVTGTHGKTTTTALVGMILKEAGRDPSIVVGGTVNFFGGKTYSDRRKNSNSIKEYSSKIIIVPTMVIFR